MAGDFELVLRRGIYFRCLLCNTLAGGDVFDTMCKHLGNKLFIYYSIDSCGCQ